VNCVLRKPPTPSVSQEPVGIVLLNADFTLRWLSKTQLSCISLLSTFQPETRRTWIYRVGRSTSATIDNFAAEYVSNENALKSIWRVIIAPILVSQKSAIKYKSAKSTHWSISFCRVQLHLLCLAAYITLCNNSITRCIHSQRVNVK